MALSSRLIQGAKPEPETLAQIIGSADGALDGRSINLMVFETRFKDKVVYCCWSGGQIVDGQPNMTLIGGAALEALINLPMGDSTTLIFQELKRGPTPIRDKVRAAVMRAEPGTKICFLGDMAGELDGEMHSALNLQKDVVKIDN